MSGKPPRLRGVFGGENTRAEGGVGSDSGGGERKGEQGYGGFREERGIATRDGRECLSRVRARVRAWACQSCLSSWNNEL